MANIFNHTDNNERVIHIILIFYYGNTKLIVLKSKRFNSTIVEQSLIKYIYYLRMLNFIHILNF